jgi:hypothetical protein
VDTAGVFKDGAATVDNDPFPPNSNAEIFSIQSPFAAINTDDPPSAIIANTSQDVTLNIIGHHDVLVATGGGNDQVLLNDRGDDLVFSGAGNDVVTPVMAMRLGKLAKLHASGFLPEVWVANEDTEVLRRRAAEPGSPYSMRRKQIQCRAPKFC